MRALWRRDPSPALSLELADLCRREGRAEEAIEVLATALERRPGHMAMRVALARCRLETGDLDEAGRLLEAVAIEDPSHLVANKLLVEIHTRRGELQRARDRLDLYTLLSFQDPDVAALERRLAEAEAGGPRSAPPAGRAEEPFELPPPVPAALDPGPSPRRPAPSRPRSWRARVAAGDEPFAAGRRGGLDPESWRRAIRDEGVFAPGDGEAAVLPPRSEAVATVTLGRLYLKQGHAEEAARIFRRVLERRPGDAAAARELAELSRSAGFELSAGELLRGGDAEGGRARRGELLRRYRRRLRPEG